MRQQDPSTIPILDLGSPALPQVNPSQTENKAISNAVHPPFQYDKQQRDEVKPVPAEQQQSDNKDDKPTTPPRKKKPKPKPMRFLLFGGGRFPRNQLNPTVISPPSKDKSIPTEDDFTLLCQSCTDLCAANPVYNERVRKKPKNNLPTDKEVYIRRVFSNKIRALRSVLCMELFRITNKAQPLSEIYKIDHEWYVHTQERTGRPFPEEKSQFKQVVDQITEGEFGRDYGRFLFHSLFTGLTNVRGNDLTIIPIPYSNDRKDEDQSKQRFHLVWSNGDGIIPDEKQRLALYNEQKISTQISDTRLSLLPNFADDGKPYMLPGIVLYGTRINAVDVARLHYDKNVCLGIYEGILQALLWPVELLINLPGFYTDDKDFINLWNRELTQQIINIYQIKDIMRQVFEPSGHHSASQYKHFSFQEYLGTADAIKACEDFIENVKGFCPVQGYSFLKESQWDPDAFSHIIWQTFESLPKKETSPSSSPRSLLFPLERPPTLVINAPSSLASPPGSGQGPINQPLTTLEHTSPLLSTDSIGSSSVPGMVNR